MAIKKVMRERIWEMKDSRTTESSNKEVSDNGGRCSKRIYISILDLLIVIY